MGNPIEAMLERVVDAVDRAGEKWHAAIRAGMSETTNAMRVRGGRGVPFTSSRLINAGPARLTGWSILNTGADPVTVQWNDGRDSSADFLGGVTIPAGASSTVVLPSPGVSAGEAVSVTSSGPVTGTTYLGAVD